MRDIPCVRCEHPQALHDPSCQWECCDCVRYIKPVEDHQIPFKRPQDISVPSEFVDLEPLQEKWSREDCTGYGTDYVEITKDQVEKLLDGKVMIFYPQEEYKLFLRVKPEDIKHPKESRKVCTNGACNNETEHKWSIQSLGSWFCSDECMTGATGIGKYLDGATADPSFTREMYPGDPPPHEPPNDHCLWQSLSGLWVETDAHFRKRIKAEIR